MEKKAYILPEMGLEGMTPDSSLMLLGSSTAPETAPKRRWVF